MASVIHMQSISLRCENNSTDLKENNRVRGDVGAAGECLHIKQLWTLNWIVHEPTLVDPTGHLVELFSD